MLLNAYGDKVPWTGRDASDGYVLLVFLICGIHASCVCPSDLLFLIRIELNSRGVVLTL